MPVVIVMLKILFFLIYRKEMLNMMRYTEDNFWYAQYDEYGSKVLEEINKRAMILMCTFTFFVQGTVFTYMLTPIIGILNLNLHRPLLVENRTRTVQILVQVLSTFARNVVVQTGISFSRTLRFYRKYRKERDRQDTAF